jgi:flagellar motor switch protein FliM
MSDILSQAEIDALMSALTSGEVNAEDIRDAGQAARVRNYDFRRAMRFSKDHIRIIERIHEHFGRLLTTHLSGQLRSVVQIQLESVDQVPYEEFVRSVPALTVLQVFEFTPLVGKVVIEMNPQIVFAMLDRLMGGVIKGPYKERELTEIELALMERVLGVLPDFLSDSWRNVEDLSPVLVSMESNPQFLQLSTPNETVLVVTLSARIGNASGLMTVCIPHVTIEPIIPKLSTQNFMDGGKARHRDHHPEMMKLNKHLMNTFVNIAVSLGTTELTLEELLDVQLGDVIPLSAPIDQSVTVNVNEIPTYTASVGTRKNHYAVKILEAWKEVSDDERGDEVVSGGDRRVAQS